MGFTRLAFADSLKDHVSELTGIPVCHFHGSLKNMPLSNPCFVYPNAVTYRDVLIQHAEVVRRTDPDVYSRCVLESIQGHGQCRRFVISDWRYRAEKDFLQTHLPSNIKLVTARVTRPGILHMQHSTETELDDETFDIHIDNDGCISDLRDTLHHVIKPIISSDPARVISKLLYRQEYPFDDI